MLQKIFFFSSDWKNNIFNVTRNITEFKPTPTKLRENDMYYHFYCIWTNNVFATFVPFITLMFFNVSIALELKSNNKKKVSLGKNQL